MQLGLIGLGKMGGNMAERLRLGGHQVIGFDFNADAVKKLTDSGSVGITMHCDKYWPSVSCTIHSRCRR